MSTPTNSGWSAGFFADGAPPSANPNQVPFSPTPTDPTPTEQTRVTRRTLRNYAEGPRAWSTRTAIYLRYISYYLTILVGVSITRVVLNDNTSSSAGAWKLLLAAILVTLATGVAGMWRFPHQRGDLVDQTKHYTLGLITIPATVIAVVWAAADSFLNLPEGSSLASMATNGLPLVFFVTVILPPILFVKMVAGYRHMFRTQMDDQEMMATYSRQDHISR